MLAFGNVIFELLSNVSLWPDVPSLDRDLKTLLDGMPRLFYHRFTKRANP